MVLADSGFGQGTPKGTAGARHDRNDSESFHLRWGLPSHPRPSFSISGFQSPDQTSSLPLAPSCPPSCPNSFDPVSLLQADPPPPLPACPSSVRDGGGGWAEPVFPAPSTALRWSRLLLGETEVLKGEAWHSGSPPSQCPGSRGGPGQAAPGIPNPCSSHSSQDPTDLS